MENPNNFLKEKYGLHTSEEVESATKRTEVRAKSKNKKIVKTGQEGPLLREKVPQNPSDRIQNYLDRFTEIIERKDPERREHGIQALKHFLHSQFVIKPEEIPGSVFLLEQRIAREQGHGDVEITDEFRERKIEQIISNQTQSLDKWIDYLSSDDAQYPDWAKYWAFRSVTEMGKLEKKEEQGKETARFQKRREDTVVSFPPLNPRALAMTIGVLRSRLEEKSKPKKDRQPVENKSVKLNDKEFQDLLSSENFSKIYSQFLIEIPEYSAEGLKEIRGEWVKYPQGSDATALVKSLEGHPLEWCTADFDTAQGQLEGGDFYVYYSFNQDGVPKIPRVAIRMEDRNIAEVRGIAADQNMDPYISPVVEEKMKEFPDGKLYDKKVQDMKILTAIEGKIENGQSLIKQDLVFLYEINGSINDFGYQRDPRIAELRSQRNPKEDAPVIFGCTPEEIAYGPDDVNEKTKAYIGKWNPEVHSSLSRNIKYIYEEFPNRKVFLRDLEFDPLINNADVAEKTLLENGHEITDWTRDILKKTPFSGEKKSFKLVSFSVENLGLPDGVSTQEIFNKAQKLGLELVPAEIAPQLRLQYKNQPIDEELVLAMEPLADSNGDNLLFSIHQKNKPWLGTTRSDSVRWGSSASLVFAYSE